MRMLQPRRRYTLCRPSSADPVGRFSSNRHKCTSDAVLARAYPTGRSTHATSYTRATSALGHTHPAETRSAGRLYSKRVAGVPGCGT